MCKLKTTVRFPCNLHRPANATEQQEAECWLEHNDMGVSGPCWWEYCPQPGEDALAGSTKYSIVQQIYRGAGVTMLITMFLMAMKIETL